MNDFVIFQLKLFVDGMKDGVVFTAAIVAFVLDLIFRRQGKQRYFYKVLKLSQHFDGWLNLHGAVEGFNSKGLSRLHISPARMRDLIMDDGDLPVEVGTPFLDRIERNESTEKGKEIWAAVDAGAEKAPQKVKDKLPSQPKPCPINEKLCSEYRGPNGCPHHE